MTQADSVHSTPPINTSAIDPDIHAPESPQDALNEPEHTNTHDLSGNAATGAVDDLEDTEEMDASDVVLGRDTNWSLQDQMTIMALEPVQNAEIEPPQESAPIYNWSSPGPLLVQSASRSNRQETRTKKLKGTPPLGATVKKIVSPDDPDEPLWTSFIVALKRGLYDVAVNVELAKGWNPVKEGEDDFRNCFSAWYLLGLERGAAGAYFKTCAEDERETERGIVKYRKRLNRLARKVFSLREDEPVAFEVLRPPAEDAQTDAQFPPPPDAPAEALTNGEIPAGDRTAWEEVRRQATEHLLRMSQANPAVKPEWIDQGIVPARLVSVDTSNGNRIWRIHSPAPATTRVVLQLIEDPMLRRFPGVEIEVLDDESP